MMVMIMMMVMKAAAQRKGMFHPNLNDLVWILGCRFGFMIQRLGLVLDLPFRFSIQGLVWI